MRKALTEEQKLAQQAYRKAYRAAHLEALRARDRQRRVEHGDAIRAREKVSRARRRENILAYHKVWWAEHADRINTQRRQKRQDDPEAARAADKEAYERKDKEKIRVKGRKRYASKKTQEALRKHVFYLSNPAIFFERSARRRAQKAGALLNDLTNAQWREIQAAYGYRCAYCGAKPKKLEQEHIQPLSKGGNHTVANVVPACAACNRRKGAGEPLVPIQPLFLTLASPRKAKTS
jgi:5-methylcytosine-specific restriction endonuclease McrA